MKETKVTDTSIKPLELEKAIKADVSLTDEQREEVLKLIQDKQFLNKLTSGLLGAGAGGIIAKYLKLSPTAQVLLAVSSFGIGRLLWESSKNDSKRFSEYNKKLKVYEIK